jgi:membrane fusion protein, multidrug efflux system
MPFYSRRKTMEKIAYFKKRRAVLAGSLGVVALAATGLFVYSMAANVSAQPTVAVIQPVQVGVITVLPQQVRIWSEFSGRTRAVDFVELRPEVSGRITEVGFQDGQSVKAGDVLFIIDPRPYAAAVDKAEANLVTAKANAEFAATELKRAANMIRTKAIAQRLYDERANADRVARAAVQAAEAELSQTRIDLDHAYVKAPITGRISRAEITLGNRVQAGAGAPVLSTIVSTDGIYVDFEVDEQTYMGSIHDHANTRAKEQQVPVELTVQGDEQHPIKGTIESFDNRIDPASGTIRARARFENSDGALVPGMFVSVRLAGSSQDAALLVPERAIGNDQSKQFIYVVEDGDKVAYRPIRLGQSARGERIVLAGVQPGDRVIVDGLQRVRPGTVVQVRELSPQQEREKLASNSY